MTRSFLHAARKSGLCVFFLLVSATPLLAQLRDDLRNELLVYIQPSALRFPAGERGSVHIDQLPFLSEALRQAFNRFSVVTIAKAFPDFDDADTTRIADGGRLVSIPHFSRIFRFQLPDRNQIDSAIALFSRIPGVWYAEKNMEAQLSSDPDFSLQWHLKNTGQSGGTSGADIKAEEAWQIFTGSSSIKIGVFDSGVETSHDEFSGKITGDAPDATGSNPNWSHGTHVAGIAAARANNNKGGRGVDWNAQINSRKIFDGNGNYLGDATASNQIISATDNGVHVMNHSWGGTQFSTTVRQAFAYAYKMNRVSIAAMGNAGGNVAQFPAAFGKGVIAVGATQDNDVRSSFSNFGAHIDVVAPGGLSTWPNIDNSDIYSTWRGNSYRFLAGTSMAAPIVSGIASLLKGYNSSLYNDDIENIIKLSADDKGNPGWDQFYGTGRVNAKNALKLITAPNQLVRLGTYTGGTVVSTQTFVAGAYGFPGLTDGLFHIQRHEVIRDIQFPQQMNPPSVAGLSFTLPQAWGNGTATSGSVTGWDGSLIGNSCGCGCTIPWMYNYGLPHTEVVPGTVTTTGCRLRTYVYRVKRYVVAICEITVDYGFLPTSPQNVQFAATVLGIPAPPKVAGRDSTESPTSLQTPETLSIEQNYPNPFNPETEIRFSLPKDTHTQLVIFDLSGREIRKVVDSDLNAGDHAVVWDGKDESGNEVASGVYLYQISAGNFRQQRKLALVR